MGFTAARGSLGVTKNEFVTEKEPRRSEEKLRQGVEFVVAGPVQSIPIKLQLRL
jgi:hypothetical protein